MRSLSLFDAPDRREEDRIAYGVVPLPFKVARDFVQEHHYAKGCHNGPTLSVGLIDGPCLIGVLMFATPCSENVRASVFGPDRRHCVTELHRLVVLDVTPRNTESWFIARSLSLLRSECPHIDAVVSFADETYGHTGIIYQASNAYYYGTSPGQRAYLDPTGRLRHKRQCGHNVTREEAAERGWETIQTGRKHRYCLLMDRGKRHARGLRGSLRLERYDYPRPLGVTRGSVEVSQ